MLNGGPLRLLSLEHLLPPPFRGMAAPLESALERWIVPHELHDYVLHAGESGRGARFAARLLGQLDIRFAVVPRDLKQIPERGGAIVVANHPHGIVEGLILTALLDSVRSDYKLVANSLLSKIDAMSDRTILVNPFRTPSANISNRAPLRRCLQWLKDGGLLVMFPAGEVAHLRWTGHSVTEPCWNPAAVRIALKAHVPVIPVFFEGSNSLGFHLAGTLHPGLRTIALPREFLKLRGKTVRVRIGRAVSSDLLTQYRTAESATEYLRSRTLFLANRPWPAVLLSPLDAPKTLPLASACGTEGLLSLETAALPADAELVRTDEFSVFVARAIQIPRLLKEIGCAREQAFRQVGEGTGKEIDLDWFDQHYYHLFLWSRRDRCLAGAYRLTLTQQVLPDLGPRGLYTGTLFHYRREFFERIGPALELGRSFVCPSYQKSYAPLLLLWKGIARFVQRHPEAAILFGAVSISREYRAASRSLIASYLSDRLGSELAPLVRPRKPWREPTANANTIKRLAGIAATLEDISFSISDIEEDGKGVPVLIRQYLKAGGRLLAFNVDPSFSHTVDALILADLRTVPVAILERYMGRSGAKSFQEWHARHSAPTG